MTADPVPLTAVVGVERGNVDPAWFTEIHETDRLDHLTARSAHPDKTSRAAVDKTAGSRAGLLGRPGSSADRSFIS